MKEPRLYLDYNASAPLLDCARDHMVEILGQTGNASSVHFEGRGAKKYVEVARAALSELVRVPTANIVFVSGATEAANHVLSPIFRHNGEQVSFSTLYVSAVEHPCVLQGGRFAKEALEIIPVLESGQVDVSALEDKLRAHDHGSGKPLVAVQYANNETGFIQPIDRIAEIVHQNDGYLVVDAVQTLGKVSIDMEATGADFLILSSHKIGGPQGCGALVFANPNLTPMPLLTGGGQENYHRGGTENVTAIAGFGAACRWHLENLTKKVRISSVRDSIEQGIGTISLEAGNGVPQPVIFGKQENRLENTSCFAVTGVRAETALMALDLDGISVSSGSACSSGKVKRSHVLEAMNVGEELCEGALRISLGWEPKASDAERFLTAWRTIIGRMAST